LLRGKLHQTFQRLCGDLADISDDAALGGLAARLAHFDRTIFARVAIQADEPPRALPPRDGVLLKNRFRRALGAE